LKGDIHADFHWSTVDVVAYLREERIRSSRLFRSRDKVAYVAFAAVFQGHRNPNLVIASIAAFSGCGPHPILGLAAFCRFWNLRGAY
jgi:hypothetical protein